MNDHPDHICRRAAGTPRSQRRAWVRARARSAERGLTLIEITIALAVVAVLFAAVISGVGALTGAKAKESASKLASTIRAIYDTAALSGRTCRLVFQLPDPRDEEASTKYWAECAEGALTSSRDRDEELREAREAAEEEAENAARGINKNREQRDFNMADDPTLDDYLSQEQRRIENRAKYSSFTTEELEPREIPAAVRLSIWTRMQKDPVDSGIAYLYFFPQGYTERAMVFVTQGPNEWTIKVSPLTGKAEIVPELLEVPK
ncbi:MAG: prepilin-type N-terminal cleavage/methylation domain-containing protein [Myxococcaceae bacterium]